MAGPGASLAMLLSSALRWLSSAESSDRMGDAEIGLRGIDEDTGRESKMTPRPADVIELVSAVEPGSS